MLFAAVFSTANADFTRKMIARWTFNSIDKVKVLTDDTGKFKLAPVKLGKDSVVSFKKGKVIVGRGIMLRCSEINNKNFPEMQKAVTIWARLKIAEVPGKDCFFLGLLDADKPADWKQQTLAWRFTGQKILYSFGRNTKGRDFGNSTMWKYRKNTSYTTLAIVLDAKKKIVRLHVDGKSVQKKVPYLNMLSSFKCFAVGRLKKHSAVKLEVDELRLYESVIPAEWIAEIEPVE
jgi:hypothetical protein